MRLATLKKYSTFENKEQLNNAVKNHITNNELNETTIEIFNYLARCSVPYQGACTVLRQSIADKFNISISTVARAFMRLRAVKAIVTYSSRRRTKKGGSGANIIQILPFSKQKETLDDTPHTTVKHTQTEGSATSLNNAEQVITYSSLNINNTLLDTHSVSKVSWQQHFVNSRPNTGLTAQTLDFFTLFANSSQEAAELIGMLYRCKKSVSEKRQALLLLEDLDSKIYQTLRRVYSTIKTSSIRNVKSYLYMALKNLFNEHVDTCIKIARDKHSEHFARCLNLLEEA